MMTEERQPENHDPWLGPTLPTGPNEVVRVETVEELSSFPDGTVVVWHSREGVGYERQAGVLDTDPDGTREIRPVSVQAYEFNTGLHLVDPPVWVLTFDDPAAASPD